MQNETEPTGRGNKRLQLAVSVLFMAAGRGAADEQRLRSVVYESTASRSVVE